MATAADWLSVTATLFSPVSTDGSMLQVNFDANKAVSHPSFNANVSAARVEHTTHLMRLEAQEIGECLKNHLGGQENLLDCHHQASCKNWHQNTLLRLMTTRIFFFYFFKRSK